MTVAVALERLLPLARENVRGAGVATIRARKQLIAPYRTQVGPVAHCMHK
jgi:hypothetical protein